MRFLFLVFLLFVAGSTESSTSYYIDATAGSDSNNGLTTGAAWKTLAKATNFQFTTTDSVLLKRGETWNEAFYFPTNGLTLDAYGTGADPILDGQGAIRFGVWIQNFVGTTTRHLHIKNFGGLAPPDDTGALWSANAGTNTIEDCWLEHHLSDAGAASGSTGYIIVRRCLITGCFDDGITLHGEADALIEFCTVSNCTQAINNDGTDMTMTVNDTLFINNGDGAGGGGDVDGLGACVAVFNRCRFKTATGAVMRPSEVDGTTYNYCVIDASAAPTQSGPYLNTGAFKVYLNNCVLYGGVAGNGYLVTGVGGTLFLTNCIIDNWWKAAYLDGTCNSDHCIFHSIGTKALTSNTSEVSTSDPLFVSPLTGDFRLQAGSPGINAGVNIGLTTDLAGSAVANPPDVGAYELITRKAFLSGSVTLSGKATTQ
jgi:hypothetical protein